MMKIERLIRIDDNKLEVPIIYKEGMKTKGIIYADRVLEKELESESIEQVANVATLPGIVGTAMAMPDIHTGYQSKKGFANG
jgi:tRNA-splicing ligase RtcB